MKRPMAVGAMVGILLAASTAAFATPVMWESIVTVPATPLVGPSGDPFSWFQAYTPYDAAHPGSSKDDPILSAKLILTSTGVQGVGAYPEEIDLVFRGSTELGQLKQDGQGPTTFTLTGADTWLRGTTGFNVTVDPDGRTGTFYLTPVTITQSKLVVWTEWTEPQPEPEPEPEPVVPAPGALLLASLGAGVVSLLRTRKVF